jgi:FkbM family methyltransferase
VLTYVYALFGALFTIASALALGTLLIRGFQCPLYDVEERLLAFIIGSGLLTAIVFVLCEMHEARKGWFLALGAVVILFALKNGAHRGRGEKFPPLPRMWFFILAAAFSVLTVVYILNATPDSVTQRLSLIDRAHGFAPNTGLTLANALELPLLFAFSIGRNSAAALVNLATLAAMALLLLCYGRRNGHAVLGSAGAILVYLSPIAHLNLAAAAIPFAVFYFFEQSLWRALRSIVRPAARVPWLVWIGLAIFGLWLFTYTNRPATLSGYFWLEQKVVDHWPVESQKRVVERLAPVLCRVGVLHPARIQTNPGVSFQLDPRDLVAVSILRGGEWQPEIWDSISPNLSEGNVFLDVGAHIGYFSMRAAVKLGKTGRILAFEPNPETLKLLRDNVAANHADNVIVEPIACTDREQMLTLYAAPSMNTGASSLARENADLSGDEPPRAYSVRGRPIDDVVRELNLSRVDAIKVDVEGAEVYVLRGAANTLKRFHPKVVIEQVPQQLAGMHTTVEDLIAVFKAAGYTHSKQIGPTDWEWTASPESR